MKPLADGVRSFFDALEDDGRTVAGLTDEEWAARDAKIAAELEAERQADSKRREGERWGKLRDNGFPARALEAAQTANESQPALERIKSWNPDEQSILVLSGATGCGKTVAAAWWASKRPWPPTFLRASTFAASSRYDRETRDGWFKASALVLDDLGTEYLDAKGSFLVDLDELLDVYYGDRKPLVITTNCKHDAFKARYGERVVDRLRECASWFSVGGSSMRGRK